MPLFLIEHHHVEAKCPTKSPEFVKKLSAHVGDENTRRMGIKLLGDWVNDDDHHAVFIIEASDQSKAAEFSQPFGMIGSVTIREGTTCEELAKKCLGR